MATDHFNFKLKTNGQNTDEYSFNLQSHSSRFRWVHLYFLTDPLRDQRLRATFQNFQAVTGIFATLFSVKN